jgi:hypothetical protein
MSNFKFGKFSKNSNFKSEKSPNFKFEKLLNFQNFKLNYVKEELNYEKADKSTSQSAFRIKLQKTIFLNVTRKKQAFDLTFSFFKSKNT